MLQLTCIGYSIISNTICYSGTEYQFISVAWMDTVKKRSLIQALDLTLGGLEKASVMFRQKILWA